MKRTRYFQFRVMILLAAAMLLLAACERPLQPDLDESPAPPPVQVDPIPQPEALPTPIEAPSEDGDPTTPPVEPAPTDPPVDAPVDPPPAGGEPPPPSGEATPAPGATAIYVVQAGDTLFRISQRYNVSMEDIITVNQLANPNRLDIGQSLIIPVGGLTDQPATTAETIHVVQAGDNLYRIGLRYGFTIAELVAYNNLTNPDRVDVGQQIRIPPRN